jgi:rhodanese-related sulfurtransferase
MERHVIICILLLSLALIAGCAQEQAPVSAPVPPTSPTPAPGTYLDLSPVEAKSVIDANPDLIIIDVSPHYDEGHLPGAVHYYLGDGSLDRAIPALDKSKKYLVYCHVDSVSIRGAQKLVDAGFENVYRLKGNYSAWVDAGYPIEK